MSKNDFADYIEDYEFEFGFKERIWCSQEEAKEYRKLLKENKPLPDGVYSERADNGLINFYRTEENSFSDEEKAKIIMYRNAKNISTIKKCVAFIAGVIAAGLIGSLIMLGVALAK